MEVILAKTAGFCFGVKRAVDTVYKEAGKKKMYTHTGRSFTIQRLLMI